MGVLTLGRTFVPYTVTASSAATNHPATNVARYERPYIIWRNGDVAGDSWLRFSLGSVQSLSHLVLHHTTAPQIILEQSANGSTWSSFGAGTYDVPMDPRVGRRKLVQSLMGFSNAYLRLRFPESLLESGFGGTTPFGDTGFPTDAGSLQYFEVGTVALIQAALPLAEGQWLPRRFVTRGGVQINDFLSGGDDRNDMGPRYVETTLTLKNRKAAAAETAEWGLVTAGDLVMLAELEADEPWRVILARVMGDDVQSEDFAFSLRDGLALQEAV